MRISSFFIHFVFLTSVITFSSCKYNAIDPDPPAEHQSLSPPGVVSPYNSQLLWSPDEQYIYFVGRTGLQMIAVGSGKISTIDARWVSCWSLTISGSGTCLYYLATTDTLTLSPTLMRYRRSDGVRDTVMSGVQMYLASPVSDDVVCGIYNTGNPVLYSPNTGTRRTIGHRIPLAYSPDGSDLLTRDQSAYDSYFLFHVADGSESSITFNHAGYINEFAWHSNGIKALRIETNEAGYDAYVYNLTTGLTDTITLHSDGVSSFTFDTDGSRIGFWTIRVTEYSTAFFVAVPAAWDCIVNVYSFSTHSAMKYTVGNTGKSAAYGAAAFSPSGTRIACTFEGAITLLPMH